MVPAKDKRPATDDAHGLGQCEERFEAFLGLSSEGYWEQDENFRFTFIAGSAYGLSGLDPETHLGTALWDHGAVPVEDGGSWDRHRGDLAARRPFGNFLSKRRDAKGDVRYVSTSGRPVFDEDNRFRGYRGTSRDVTEQKREEQLRVLEHAVNRNLASAASVSVAIRGTIRAICETEGWDCGRYFAVDESAGVLRFAEAWGIPDDGVQRFIAASGALVYRPGVGLSGRAWQSGQPMWSTDVSKDPRSSSASSKTGPSRELGVHGTFLFPLLSGQKTLGVLSFASRKAREPEKQLLEAIHVIGRQIGQFVQRKRAEEIVRESEERFRSMTKLSSDIYWEQDRDYRFSVLSEAGPEWYGQWRARAIGQTLWDQDYVNATPERWARHVATLDAREPFRDLELCWLDDFGNKGWIGISGEPVSDASGEFKGYRGVGKDITARKRTEELQALEHAVTRYLAEADGVQSALQAAIRAFCETETWECGRYLQVDEAAGVVRQAAAWGIDNPAINSFIANSTKLAYAPGQGLTGSVWQSGQPLWVADISKDERTLQKGLARETGLHGTVLFPVIAEGKTIGVLAFNSRQIRKPDERLLEAARVIGSQIGQFVQRLRAGEAVRESEERFRSLTNLSSDLYWEQDEQFRFTSFSGMRSQRVSTHSVLQIGKKRWEQHYVNMDTDAWNEHIALLMAHKPFRDLELCRIDEDGRKIWISVSGEPVFDSSGVFKGYRGVGRDVTERRNDEERIQFLASHDALTSLPNRAMFAEVLNVAIQNARRYDRSFAVLFIDLDGFKIINDTLGHGAGDKLLLEMAKRLAHAVRSSDVVARLGGDEFVVLVQEVSEPQQVATVARKILTAVAEPMTILGQECRVGASIGVCMFPHDAEDEHALMKNADTAMYRAKKDGKNNCKFYSEDMNARQLEERLRQRVD